MDYKTVPKYNASCGTRPIYFYSKDEVSADFPIPVILGPLAHFI